MARGNRLHMKIAERAKQFMPFAALKGYEEALALQEKVVTHSITLTEAQREELDQRIKYVKTGTMLDLIYFDGLDFIKISGLVSRVDMDARLLKVVNTKIFFKDIYYISIDKYSE